MYKQLGIYVHEIDNLCPILIEFIYNYNSGKYTVLCGGGAVADAKHFKSKHNATRFYDSVCEYVVNRFNYID